MYLFYLDESGEREYSSPARYFALCALGVPVEQWAELNSKVLMLKKTYFDSLDVEIKSNWLRHPRERKRRYIQPYDVTEQELSSFTEELYDALLSVDCVLLAAVVDKAAMVAQYTSPQPPSSLAYRLVFERVELFLKRSQCHGILIFDKISERNVIRGYENLLARQHQKFLTKGTDFLNVSQIVEGLLFIPSHENNFVQLADLCAYNIYRQCSSHGESWDLQRGFQKTYDYFARISSIIDCTEDGTYAGWGLQLFPGSPGQGAEGSEE